MENLNKQPKKGILKSSSSFEQPDPIPVTKRESVGDIKWDEMNILQTLHPVGKDYGLMKIDEPKTPYSYSTASDGEEASSSSSVPVPVEQPIDEEKLLQRIAARERRLSIEDSVSGGDDEEDEENMTEEEKKKKREFEMKRKSHYNEFQAVKLARQLLEKEEEEEEEEDEVAPEGSEGRGDLAPNGACQDEEASQEASLEASLEAGGGDL